MPQDKPMVLINPVARWAVNPADAGRIKQLEGAGWPKGLALPQEDDMLTLDFLVDPQTLQPVAVRVAEVWVKWSGDHHDIAIVVTRAH